MTTNSTNKNDSCKNIETGIGPITDKIIKIFVEKMLSEKHSFVEPITENIYSKCFPMFIIMSMSYVILILLLIFIIIDNKK